MARQKEMPRWASLLFLLLGLYIILISTGVLPAPSGRGKRALLDGPRHWQLTCFGVAFVCAAIAVAFPRMPRWLRGLNGVVLLPCFLAPMAWLLFYSGAVDVPMQILGGFILLIGGGGGATGLVMTMLGKSTDFTVDNNDPLAVAEVYLRYGRRAQAEQILLQAMQSHPARAAEFERKLLAIRHQAN